MKYASLPFGKMSADQRKLSSHAIILKIHAITGWIIPISEQILDVLVEQFEKKLNESYQNVNQDEFEYAFRNKGIEVKDWGKALNLTMIDEVMIPYLERRFELSRMEESMKSKSLMIDEKRELTDEDWSEWLEDMKSYSLKLLPCAAYDYLVKNELLTLTNAQKHEYMDKAINILQGDFEPATKEILEFLNMKKNGVFSPVITSSLITISKRLAIYEYLRKI